MGMLGNDEIQFIKDTIKIENEVSKYINLSKKGSYYYGKCPFHDDHKEKLYVNPIKQYFACPICNFTGNVIMFIQKKFNFHFRVAVQYLILNTELLHERYGYTGVGQVYVLRLVNNKYYIGYTENYCQRMHSHFSGNGSKWTKENSPVEICKVYKNVNEKFEDDLSIMYMTMFGHTPVRGGKYHPPDLKYKDVKNDICNSTKEGVFILKLEDNKYFIGYALNLDWEVKKHFSGQGCEWTKKYKPLKLIKIDRTRNLQTTEKIIMEYIRKYGWENVRGYHWDKIDLTPPKI